MDCSNAHASTVYCIISVWEGRRFLTCSADAQIKLWGTMREFNFSGHVGENDTKSNRRKKKPTYYPPVCLGEMWGHTDQVKILLKLSETAFVSGGHDNLIILWRDGEEQSLIRNKDAATALKQCHNSLNPDVNLTDDQDSSVDSGLQTAPEEFRDEESTEKDEDYEEPEEDSEDQNRDENQEENRTQEKVSMSSEEEGKSKSEKDYEGASGSDPQPKYNLTKMMINNHFGNRDNSSVRRIPSVAPVQVQTQKLVPDVQSGMEITRRKDTEESVMSHTPLLVSTLVDKKQTKKVPVYIFDFAENLLKEDNMSLEDIKENLTKQGHSSGIVEAVILKLKQTHGL